MFALVLLLPLLLGDVAAAALHPNSQSRTVVQVEGRRVTARIRCQIESVREVLDVDPDGNWQIDADEFAPLADEVGAYLLERYRLLDGPDADARALPGRVEQVQLVTEDLDALFFSQFVDCDLAWELPARPERLDIEMELFLVTSPTHTDTGLLVWPGGQRVEYRLWGGSPRVGLEAPPLPPEPSLADDLQHGAWAAWSGGRHLVFVLALLVAAPRLRTFAMLLLAYLVSAAFALGVVTERLVTPSAESLQLGVALSVAWVGALTLLRRSPRPPWAEALLFGLLHGAALASVAPMLPPVESLSSLSVLRPLALLVGAAAVLVAGAALALLLLRPLPRRPASAGDRDTRLVPGYARDMVSLGAALLGTWWAASQLAV